MVEAIDKQSNFPIPSVRQRLPQPPSSTASRPGSDGRPRQSSQSSLNASTRRQSSSNAGGPSGQADARQGVSGASGASTSGRDKTVGDYVAEGIGAEKEKVISPELRVLLSREVPKLEKTEVREHGGGVGS